MTISTHDLTGLPDIAGFRRLTRSLAALDAVMSPEWADRYYSFDSHWSEGELKASMRDGSGDQWCAILCAAGVALVGLAHESPSFAMGTPKPWVFRDLPAAFHANLRDEPAFDTSNATFCIWRLASSGRWECGPPEPGAADGSGELLSILAGDPQQYVDFAAEYYEVNLALDDVRAVYDHAPITPELAARLNDEAEFEALLTDLAEIGYPETAAGA